MFHVVKWNPATLRLNIPLSIYLAFFHFTVFLPSIMLLHYVSSTPQNYNNLMKKKQKQKKISSPITKTQPYPDLNQTHGGSHPHPQHTHLSGELLISKPNNPSAGPDAGRQQHLPFKTPLCVFLHYGRSGGTGSGRKGAINLTQPDMWPSRSWLKTLLWKSHEPGRGRI